MSRWAVQQPQIFVSPKNCQGCFAARSRPKVAPAMDRISGRFGARVQPSGRTPEDWLFDDQALPAASVGAALCRDGLCSSPRSLLNRKIARAALQPFRDPRQPPQWTAFQVGPAPGFNLPGERRRTGCLTIRPCRYLWERPCVAMGCAAAPDLCFTEKLPGLLCSPFATPGRPRNGPHFRSVRRPGSAPVA